MRFPQACTSSTEDKPRPGDDSPRIRRRCAPDYSGGPPNQNHHPVELSPVHREHSCRSRQIDDSSRAREKLKSDLSMASNKEKTTTFLMFKDQAEEAVNFLRLDLQEIKGREHDSLRRRNARNKGSSNGRDIST